MKQLIDILNESVFDIDDEQITNKSGIELNIDMAIDTTKRDIERTNKITVNELKQVIIDIRDNNIGVERGLYQPVQKFMYQIKWKLCYVNYTNNPAIKIRMDGKFGVIGEIVIYYTRSNANKLVIAIPIGSLFKIKLHKYIKAAVEKIRQSNDAKYKNFNALIK